MEEFLHVLHIRIIFPRGGLEVEKFGTIQLYCRIDQILSEAMSLIVFYDPFV